MKLAEEVSEGAKRDVLISKIINRSDIFNAKVRMVNEFWSEMKIKKSTKYIDNGDNGLGMINRSKIPIK